jgi:hypothetical protein
MNVPGAIILAGALIAATILMTNHWQLTMSYNGTGAGILRLNRWTGHVEDCREEKRADGYYTLICD